MFTLKQNIGVRIHPPNGDAVCTCLYILTCMMVERIMLHPLKSMIDIFTKALEFTNSESRAQ